jgi:SAM-dependent methyltransferase
VLIHTRCPLDGPEEEDVEVYPASGDPERVGADTFSARREPDRVHYRMVRNHRTGCLRADPILDAETVGRLYRSSQVTYESWSEHAAATYSGYVRQTLPLLPDRRGVLEIGCGHGFFLERLLEMGFEQVRGVEPSADAARRAKGQVREHIVSAAFDAFLFPARSFSLICGFQVLDHLAEPNRILEGCRRMLAPGGLMLWICHDERAPLARLLGRFSPIVDIQHVVLYNRDTVRRLFERNGFVVSRVFGVSNRYPLAYWASLCPMPRGLRPMLQRLLGATGLSRLPLRANLGNLGVIAANPA